MPRCKKHYYSKYEQKSGFYWLICEDCGYKMQLVGIQKSEQAEAVRLRENGKERSV